MSVPEACTTFAHCLRGGLADAARFPHRAGDLRVLLRAPCPTHQYQRGEHVGDCPEARECALALDAAETGVLCRCACPEPPPDDGVATVEPACVRRPGLGWSCAETLDAWVLPETTLDGTLRTGCGASVVSVILDQDDLECVYDEVGGLIGQTRRSKTPTGCEGVTAWQNGVVYSSCAGEMICAFGDADVGVAERCTW